MRTAGQALTGSQANLPLTTLHMVGIDKEGLDDSTGMISR